MIFVNPMRGRYFDIPFNRSWVSGRELEHITRAQSDNRLSADGKFTELCRGWLQYHTGSPDVLATSSGTTALEIAALLTGIQPGDEVILPSFTFPSTANAFVLRGAVPVFVDIRPDTLNIDERLVEDAVTSRTRVVVAVHYAGVGCEMDALMKIAKRRKLTVVEDAAQGLGATYRERALGTFGSLGVLSFHETKNVTAGEGGALLINDERLKERAEVVGRFGTDRLRFERGETDCYRWVDMGFSGLPSEINAAYLWAQLESFDEINARRMAVWQAYHDAFADLETAGLVRRPVVPEHCRHNAHMYYLLLPDRPARDGFIRHLADRGIQSVFHYMPLHDAPMGRRLGRAAGPLLNTIDAADRLARLPLWVGLEDGVDHVIDAVLETARRGA